MITIEPVRPEDWTAALECALERLPLEERTARVRDCTNLLANGSLDPRSIWVARRADEIVGAQVSVAQAGAAGLCWLPARDDSCADELVRAGLSWCASQGCKIAHAMARGEELAWTAPLCRCGFRRITQFHQLGRGLADLPALPESSLQWQSLRPEIVSKFAATLERTYEGTLDCPELNGTRTVSEIMAGHRGQGIYLQEMWWLAYADAAPVGVLIFVEWPDALTWELAYLGLVPEQRRRGYARTILLHAMHELRRRLATGLTLCVDTRNIPARRLYESLGFVESEISNVFLHVF